MSSKIDVFYSDYGRGVKAIKPIKKDELLAVAHCIRLEYSTLPSEVTFYVFSSEKRKISLLALGIISLINHNKKENCYWTYCQQTNRIYLYAKKPIKVGEELFHNYGWSDKFIAGLARKVAKHNKRRDK